MRQTEFPYLPKDFIETAEGLIFAVVSYQPQAGKVGGFLRYVRSGSAWSKVGTDEANALLTEYYPQYLYHSKQFDAAFHAVSPDVIVKHHQPEKRLEQVLKQTAPDEITLKLQQLIPILVRYGVNCNVLGLTGSMLIGQQTAQSDIDLVVYGRTNFHLTRAAVRAAVLVEELMLLDETLMRDNFHRRAGALNFDDFSWHENRKFNKAVIQGTKFDIGMVCSVADVDLGKYQKQDCLTLVSEVVDDQYAFDFPARYIISDNVISEVLVYTQTYVGQAIIGEQVEVSGAVESDVETGKCRLVVGSSREALGEYIKVCR